MAEQGEWPHYVLGDTERQLLRDALQEVQGAKSAAPFDQLERQFAALRCAQCHSRDGSQEPSKELNVYFSGDEDVELGDEGRIPPDLSAAGYKLRGEWLQEVLEGDARARPYIATRMPHYAAYEGDSDERSSGRIAGMAQRLAHASGVEAESESVSKSAELILAGRQLAGSEGLNCISCHVFGDLPAAGVPGPDLKEFARRLRYPWWVAYAKAPDRLKPGTRMPSFFWDATTSATDVLDGESAAQIDALWSYFQQEDAMPVPVGVTRGEELQLVVGSRPRIFRGFMDDAGSRAIAVGYPIGCTSLSTRSCADSLMRGRESSQRGGILVGSRWPETLWPGEQVWRAPAGAALRIGDADTSVWRFRGYRFESDGTPLFRYDSAQGDAEAIQVEESFVPGSRIDVLLRRTFRVMNLQQTLWVQCGDRVSFSDLENCRIEVGRSVRNNNASPWRAVMVVDPQQPVQFSLEVAR